MYTCAICWYIVHIECRSSWFLLSCKLTRSDKNYSCYFYWQYQSGVLVSVPIKIFTTHCSHNSQVTISRLINCRTLTHNQIPMTWVCCVYAHVFMQVFIRDLENIFGFVWSINMTLHQILIGHPLLLSCRLLKLKVCTRNCKGRLV